MAKVRRLHVEDLPPDHDWQAVADRLAAAARRKADAVWRRKTSARHRRKKNTRGKT